MSGRTTQFIVDPDGTRLGSYAHVARELGDGVYPQLVESWAKRREATGFPKPVRRDVIAGRAADLYDLDACAAWRSTYRPQPGVTMSKRSTNPNRGSAARVADLLEVSTKQVCRWADRSRTNGCPTKGDDGFYDLAEWVIWHHVYQAARAA